MIEELLSKGAEIDVTDKIGWRPLSYAIAHNNIDAVERLIDKGSKVNLINESNSPIHIASALGHKDIVKFLMNKGADIHSQNQKHQTPVDIACENSHYGVVNLLLSGSSNQIEEYSKSNFKNATTKCLNLSFVKTASLTSTMSTNNITSMSLNTTPNWLENSLNIFNSRNVGSEEYISFPSAYLIKTLKSNPEKVKKSESLNAIFVDGDKSKKHTSETLDSFLKNDTEIVLPYPSKFSTSDALKLKSSNLSFKNHSYINHNVPLKDKTKMQVLRTRSTEAKSINGEEVNNIQGEEVLHMNNHNQFMSPKETKKLSKFAYSYTKRSLLETDYKETNSNNLKIQENSCTPNNKLKYKFDFNTRNKEVSRLYNDKLIQHSVNENSGIRSSSTDNNCTSCYKWIQSIDLLMIWDTLVNEGFDSFLSLSLATDEELLILCNNRIDHLDTLKKNLNSLSIPSMNQLMFSLDIQKTLIQLGLEQYSSNFIKEGYFFINNLPKVSERLMDQLEIIKIGNRRILMECLQVQVQNCHSGENRNRYNCSVTNLPSQILSCSSMLPYLSIKTNVNKCNSLPRCNMDNIVMSKKIPPPIPPRSSSIPSGNVIKLKTLDDVIMESKYQETLSPRKKNYKESKDIVTDLANLDDIMTMLNNLSKDLN